MKDYIDTLCAKYPTATTDVYCGIEYPAHWNEHVEKAVAVIDAAGFNIAQIKTKFGRLRIYVDYPKSVDVWKRIAIDMAISKAEADCGLYKYNPQ